MPRTSSWHRSGRVIRIQPVAERQSNRRLGERINTSSAKLALCCAFLKLQCPHAPPPPISIQLEDDVSPHGVAAAFLGGMAAPRSANREAQVLSQQWLNWALGGYNDSPRWNEVATGGVIHLMLRPQFSIQTLLWLTLAVAAFVGGMTLQSHLDQPSITRVRGFGVGHDVETLTTPDGKRWVRIYWAPE